MNTTETLQRFEEITNHYLHELNNLSMEQLKRKPSENEWSLGQMYLHLIKSALYMQLRHADICSTKQVDTVARAGEKTEMGEAVFAQGGFPSERIQVPPSPEYTPQQPASKEQIIEGLNTVLRRMKEVEPALETASSLHTIPHPKLGALDAKEWFMLVEMHYRHHLLQEQRLKKYLESNE